MRRLAVHWQGVLVALVAVVLGTALAEQGSWEAILSSTEQKLSENAELLDQLATSLSDIKTEFGEQRNRRSDLQTLNTKTLHELLGEFDEMQETLQQGLEKSCYEVDVNENRRSCGYSYGGGYSRNSGDGYNSGGYNSGGSRGYESWREKEEEKWGRRTYSEESGEGLPILPEGSIIRANTMLIAIAAVLWFALYFAVEKITNTMIENAMESGDVIEEMRRVTFFGALFVLARSVAIASLAIISTDRVNVWFLMTLGFDRSLGASVDGFMARDAGMFSDSISSAFAILIGFYAASNLIQLSENVRPLMTVVSRQIDELDLAALMDISILTKLTNSLYYTLAFCYFLFGNSTQSSFVAAIILILESKGLFLGALAVLESNPVISIKSPIRKDLLTIFIALLQLLNFYTLMSLYRLRAGFLLVVWVTNIGKFSWELIAVLRSLHRGGGD